MLLSFGLLSDHVVFPFIAVVLGGSIYGILCDYWGRRRAKEDGRIRWSVFVQTIMLGLCIAVIALCAKHIWLMPANFCTLPLRSILLLSGLLHADYYTLPVGLVLSFTFLVEGAAWRRVKSKATAMLSFGKFLAVLTLIGFLFGALMVLEALGAGGIPAALCR